MHERKAHLRRTQGQLGVQQLVSSPCIGGWTFQQPKGKGRREIVIPPPLVPLLHQHRKDQQTEQLAAGEAWEEWGLVWCQPNGRPIDPHDDWDWCDSTNCN